MKDLNKELDKKFVDIETAIQRYVVGQMSNSEAEDFEMYFLAKPELVEQIEIAQSMSIGLANSPENVSPMVSEVKQSSRTMTERVIDYLTIKVPAFAVVALAAVLSPLMFHEPNTVETGLVENIELLNFSTATTRSTAQHSVIDLSDTEGQPALIVKIKSIKHPNYKLKLFRESANTPVWTSAAFQVGPLRDRLLVLPSDLKGYKYQIEVVGVGVDLTESQVEFCHYSEVCN